MGTLILPIGELVIHGAIKGVEGRFGLLESRRIFSLFQNGLLFLLGLQRDFECLDGELSFLGDRHVRGG